MTPPKHRGGARRPASKGSTPRRGKAPGASAQRPKGASKTPRAAAKQQGAVSPSEQALPLSPLLLGFVQGVAPGKWAERWARTVREQELQLVPLGSHEVERARTDVDVLLERVPHGERPVGTRLDEPQTRHGIRLYEETVALVLAADHELATQATVSLDELQLLSLLEHPDHLAQWPTATAWQDTEWRPTDSSATLELVATGLGGALMSFPLARHLAKKRVHAVLPLRATDESDSVLPGTEIWASWSIERDAPDVQRLIGVLRGRGPRSSR